MTIITNRAQRRMLKRVNDKQSPRLQEITREHWKDLRSTTTQIRVLRSRDFLVQVFPAPPPAIVRLSVCRTILDGDRWMDGITWDELQRLKQESGYGAHHAVEIYPSDFDIVNVANMRHLWILDAPLPFAWRKEKN